MTDVKAFSIDELTSILDAISHRVEQAEKVIADKTTKLADERMRLARGEAEVKALEEKTASDKEELTKYMRFRATLIEQKEEQDELEKMRLEEIKVLLLQIKVENGGIASADVDRIAKCIGIEVDTGFKDDDEDGLLSDNQ